METDIPKFAHEDGKQEERKSERDKRVAILHCAHQKKWRKLGELEKQRRKDLG